MMWAIFSDETPLFVGDNRHDLEKTCQDLNSNLQYTFTIREWFENDIY